MGRWNKDKKPSGGGRFVMLKYQVIESAAWGVLTNAERLVLIDMIRVEQRASRFGKDALPEGFPYSFSMCQAEVSARHFVDCRQRLVEVGFIDFDPVRQRAHRRKRFSPSRRWENYEPTHAEAAAIRKRAARKAEGLAQNTRRMTDFHAEGQTDPI